MQVSGVANKPTWPIAYLNEVMTNVHSCLTVQLAVDIMPRHAGHSVAVQNIYIRIFTRYGPINLQSTAISDKVSDNTLGKPYIRVNVILPGM